MLRAGRAGETAAFQGISALGEGRPAHVEGSFTPETFRVVATLPESLFLKALTEGLPMIRPGAVDICGLVMVRYSVIYGVTR